MRCAQDSWDRAVRELGGGGVPVLRCAWEGPALTARGEQVWQLLRSYLCWIPSPPTATGQMVRRSAKRGEIAAKTVPCPTCKGEQQHRVRGMLVPCLDCGRTGKVKVDPFTGRRPSEDTGFRDADARHRAAN